MPKTTLPFKPAEYALVADRIQLFYERFPTGRIMTRLVARDREIVFRAAVYRSIEETAPAATGWASEREGDGEINIVACLENTETSAVGRALANLGFTASLKRPSYEEMQKAERARRRLMRVSESTSVSFSDSSQAASGHPASSEVQAGGTRSAGNPAADEIRVLLDLAQRAGMPPRRAARLLSMVEAVVDPSDPRLASFNRRLRRWIAARHDRIMRQR